LRKSLLVEGFAFTIFFVVFTNVLKRSTGRGI
jgi:hypothetical protein